MEKYIPDIYQKSIYTLDYSKLLSRGIKCILFDLDNTLVGARSDELIPKTKDLIIGLKQKGFKVIIFSNSPKSRVSKFSEILDVKGVHLACKPFQGKLKKLIKDTGFKLDEIVIIGDQMMTDILVGNKVGITTILVNPVSNKDHILSKFSRHSEYKKMKKLRDKDLFCKGRYYD